MRMFRVLPHVGDVRLRVEGSSPEELFAASLEGMNHIIKKGFCRSNHAICDTREIHVTSVDMTALLVDFLSEVLTLSQIHHVVYCQVALTILSPNALAASISGAKIQGFDEDIKAVSYHEAEIERNSKGHYQTNIVFDI